MKTGLICLFVVLMSIFTSPGRTDQVTVSYSLLEVEDGDTLLVDIDGQAERVQLLGINAPEDTENPKFKLDLQQTGLDRDTLLAIGQAATHHLGSLVTAGEQLGLPVDLSVKDRYGRIPAVVLTEQGRPLAEDMVLNGYAVALPDDALEPVYIKRLDRLERFSQKSGNGLWKSHSQTMHNWYDRTR